VSGERGEAHLSPNRKTNPASWNPAPTRHDSRATRLSHNPKTRSNNPQEINIRTDTGGHVTLANDQG